MWEPPRRVEYWWHIFLDRDKATKVSVSFTPGVAGTSVRLENSGFEVFGDVNAAIQREKTLKHWLRAWKIALIEQHNPVWRDLYEDLQS